MKVTDSSSPYSILFHSVHFYFYSNWYKIAMPITIDYISLSLSPLRWKYWVKISIFADPYRMILLWITCDENRWTPWIIERTQKFVQFTTMYDKSIVTQILDLSRSVLQLKGKHEIYWCATDFKRCKWYDIKAKVEKISVLCLYSMISSFINDYKQITILIINTHKHYRQVIQYCGTC